MVATLLVGSVNAFAYVRTHDNATQVDPQNALTGDIIKVAPDKVAYYCDFEDQIVAIHPHDKGHTQYLCSYIGSKRKVLSS